MKRQWLRTVGLGLVLWSPRESIAAVCSASTEITSSPAYLLCRSATGIDFAVTTGNKKSDFSAAAFCGNEACATLWDAVSARGELSCFKSYDSGQSKISDRDYATNCFIASGLWTPAPTAATPTTRLTPTKNAGGNSTKASANKKANGSRANSSEAVDDKDNERSDSDIGAAGVELGTVSPEMTTVTVVSTSSGGGRSESNIRFTEAAGSSGSSESREGRAGFREKVEEASVPNESAPLSSFVPEPRSDPPRSAKTGQIREGSKDASRADSDDDVEANNPSSIWIASGGSTGGVMVVVIVLLYFRKREAKFVDTKGSNASGGDDYSATIDSSRSRLGIDVADSNRSLPSSRFAFWEDDKINAVRIPYEKLEIGSLISRGGYGQVHRGTYRDQLVAIKSLLPERRKDMRQIEKFLDEVKLMATLEHPNIVGFVGVAWDSLNELCAVSEFMTRGDLRTLLAQFAENERSHPKGFDTDKMKIAVDIATALTYLHSLQPAVLHRDLKSRNVLLDDDLTAKLTDFGVSRERVDCTMTIGIGSSLWMAPEIMIGGRYDDKADVFSFGVLLSELDLHSLPYSHALEPGTNRKLPDTVVVQMVATGRISVEFTDEASSLVAQIGRRCVTLDPADRPSAAEVQHQLHQLWMYPDEDECVL